jgi:hypothetical protein
MKTHALFLFLAVANCVFADRITEAVHKGMVTKALIDSLTIDDVPEKWRSEKKDEDGERHFVRSFYRGGQKVLSVMWATEWTGKRAKMFIATIYRGDKRIYSVPRLEDSLGFSLAKNDEGYEIFLVLKDGGPMTLTVMHDDGYFEVVTLDGRETRVIDDLSYAKQALSLEHILLPLVGAIKGTIEDQKANKAPKPAPPAVTPRATERKSK